MRAELQIAQGSVDEADFERAAVTRLELENFGLRRLVVELLERNQMLREEMRSRYVLSGCDSQPAAG